MKEEEQKEKRKRERKGQKEFQAASLPLSITLNHQAYQNAKTNLINENMPEYQEPFWSNEQGSESLKSSQKNERFSPL